MLVNLETGNRILVSEHAAGAIEIRRYEICQVIESEGVTSALVQRVERESPHAIGPLLLVTFEAVAKAEESV